MHTGSRNMMKPDVTLCVLTFDITAGRPEWGRNCSITAKIIPATEMCIMEELFHLSGTEDQFTLWQRHHLIRAKPKFFDKSTKRGGKKEPFQFLIRREPWDQILTLTLSSTGLRGFQDNWRSTLSLQRIIDHQHPPWAWKGGAALGARILKCYSLNAMLKSISGYYR